MMTMNQMASPTGSQAGTASRRVFDLPEIRRRIFHELPSVNVTDMMVVNQTALWTVMDVWCTRKVAHELPQAQDVPEQSVVSQLADSKYDEKLLLTHG